MHAALHWLGSLPPGLVYLVIFLVIAVESMGVPLPGEITLVSGALLAASGHERIAGVAAAATAGAIVGDSLGYLVGYRGGRPLLVRLGRRFPAHLGPAQLARAERLVHRRGVWAIFFGRFIALLRVLAGPLAGALRLPYGRFLAANAAGGVVWASGTALVVYYAGQAAEHWLTGASWIGLGLVVLAGIVSTLVLRWRLRRATAAAAGTPPVDDAPLAVG